MISSTGSPVLESAVVLDLVFTWGGRCNRLALVPAPERSDRAVCRVDRARIVQRQVQREGAALPCTLVSLISPPSSIASSRLMASPRPVPPYLREVPASACWKASKINRCFSGATPMPVSDTANATTWSAILSTG